MRKHIYQVAIGCLMVMAQQAQAAEPGDNLPLPPQYGPSAAPSTGAPAAPGAGTAILPDGEEREMLVRLGNSQRAVHSMLDDLTPKELLKGAAASGSERARLDCEIRGWVGTQQVMLATMDQLMVLYQAERAKPEADTLRRQKILAMIAELDVKLTDALTRSLAGRARAPQSWTPARLVAMRRYWARLRRVDAAAFHALTDAGAGFAVPADVRRGSAWLGRGMSCEKRWVN